MNRLDHIALVRQEHPEGCMLACLAMICGKTYQEVRAYFERDDPNEHGLSIYPLFEYLSREGFAYQFLNQYTWGGPTKEREVWPLPLPAKAAICAVDGGRGGENSHGVVLLRDGTVLDPTHGQRKWSDYTKCGMMLPLWDMQAANR